MIDTQYQIGTLVFVEATQYTPPKPAPEPERFPELPPCMPTRNQPLTGYTPPTVEDAPRHAPWVEVVIMAGVLPLALALLIEILTL